jgi:hypothetical protein
MLHLYVSIALATAHCNFCKSVQEWAKGYLSNNVLLQEFNPIQNIEHYRMTRISVKAHMNHLE